MQGAVSRQRRQLEAAASTARRKLDELETAERRKANRVLIGRCFKYHNSYGGTDRWWLYLMVTAMSEGGALSGWQYQVASNGNIEIEPFLHKWSMEKYQSATETEFLEGWHGCQQAIGELAQLPKAARRGSK